MMTNRHETARLSDYLDGELTATARAEVDAHLADCPECADTLEELRTVVHEAGRLPELPPAHDLWPGIEARLLPRGDRLAEAGPDVVPISRARRVVMTVPQLVAAAIALVLFSAGGMWLTVGGGGEPDASPVVTAPQAAPVTTVMFTESDRAMTQLEQEYRSQRSELDPETIRVVERNLAIIDQAIKEARDALASDPASGFLSAHLANAMRQKMDLLRRATTIAQTEI
ncbi:MAG: anti-sigma factor family protein [Candidatus Longimicrobiales bacterium M2_2A_002]